MNVKNGVLLVLGLVGVPAVYFLLQWLIVDVQISPTWFTLLFVYMVLVIPQYNATHKMDQMNAYEEDIPVNSVPSNKLNLIIFVNDWILAQYYDDGTLIKRLISWTMRISAVVLVITTLYNNVLVVFIDIGATGALISIYAMLISLALWFISKALIVGHLIFNLMSPAWLILAPFYPFGFMAISSGINGYLYEAENQRTQNVLGEQYEN